MQDKIELIKSDGTKNTVDLISVFQVKVNGESKNYALMTANEIDQNGLIKILASEIKDDKLFKITMPEEWNIVKNVMRSIISSSKGDFNYLNIKNLKSRFHIEDDYAKIIAVEDVAKQQLIKDYNEKKPAEEVKEAPIVDSPIVDPNEIIYPNSEILTNNDSEVIPGIAELTNNENIIDQPEKVVETKENVENTNINSDKAREIMVNKIIAAVDEYIKANSFKSDSELEISALKTNIAQMQQQLKNMADTLNTQE